jgi:hypothetical protein
MGNPKAKNLSIEERICSFWVGLLAQSIFLKGKNKG